MKEVNAVGIIVMCKGKILLLRRSENDSYPGKWGLPGGGVENGEEFDAAAVRELREETGLNFSKLECLGNHDYKEPGLIIRYKLYRITFKNKPVIVINEEHSDYMWVSYDAALHMDDLIFKKSFDKLLLKLRN